MTRLSILRDRAEMLAKSRAFFATRGVIEVDCPLLSPFASIDAHIDLIPATPVGERRYLHSSPEYGMKRLLVEGMGDIYQLAHVFRDGESGIRHNPEFMMAEWYRVEMPFSALIDETLDFVRLFLGPLSAEIVSYRETFRRYTGLDYVTASPQRLLDYIKQEGIPSYAGIEKENKDALLNLILGAKVEPQLGSEKLYALAYYPSTQAALAQTRQHGDEQVAERFEVYYQGVELANGYHELGDAVEQRRRLIDANHQRLALGKKALPIDENFLKALEQGLPDSCGVAVGVDRLMMLRHKRKQIADVMPFTWDFA